MKAKFRDYITPRTPPFPNTNWTLAVLVSERMSPAEGRHSTEECAQTFKRTVHCVCFSWFRGDSIFNDFMVKVGGILCPGRSGTQRVVFFMSRNSTEL